MIFDFSKKWDNKKKLPVFDFKKAKELETSLLNTKCGKCSDLQYSDIKGYYFCGYYFQFLPKSAPFYFASECPRINSQSEYENTLSLKANEAAIRWAKRGTDKN